MKIRKIALILAVLLLVGSFASCGSGSGSEEKATETVEEKQEISILNSNLNTDGLFEVEFAKEDRTYCGIADDKGQIFYYTENYKTGKFWGIDYKSMGENAIYISETIDDKEVYTVINSDGGKKTFTEDDFDKILGAGGGYILVYKNTGDISKEEHSYGLINSDGEWEKELTPGVQLPEKFFAYNEPYDYLGNKVFAQIDQYNRINAVFDCDKNSSIGFRNCVIKSKGEYNGKFIVNFKNMGCYSTPYGSEEKDGDGSYLFSTDGSYEKLPYILSASDKIAVYEKSGKLQIMDLETNKVSQYNDFPISHIKNISFKGEYGLIVIYGLDGKYYFTVVDSKGEQQFEPRLCSDMKQVKFYGDRTVYKAENNFYEMIDNKGNVIISKDKNYTLYFYGNVIKAKTGSGELYFDKDGNEITFSLKG